MNIDIGKLRKKECEYCKCNITYFVESYCHIEDKDAEELIQPFQLWQEQKETLNSINEHRLNIILKARQLGISWLVIAYTAWLVLLSSGRTAIMLSRSEEEAKELIRRLVVMLRYMPSLVQEKGFEVDGWQGAIFDSTALTVTVMFDGEPNSIVKAFPSSPSSVRSFTADLLIFDEWAFQMYAHEIWASAFPSINRPSGGKLIGVSTIDKGTLFEELFTTEGNGFNKIFIPWYADPRRTKEWYDNTKMTIGEVITQEYPATIEEALTIIGGAFFPEVRRETHITDMRLFGNLKRYVCIDYGLDMLSVHWIELDTAGNAVVYREYDEANVIIAVACDIIRDLTDEYIDLYLAPPDLWSRSQESGKSRAQLFRENGINLTKTSNDFPAGCMGIKEWLRIVDGLPKLRIFDAPNLYNCLTAIQRDKSRPNVYAKTPHRLTHDIDSIRCFCVYWTRPARAITESNKRKWNKDMIEDYKNASKEDKAMLLERYGDYR